VWRSSWFPGAIPAPRAVAIEGEYPLVTAWGDQWGGSAVLNWDATVGAAAATVEGFASPANAMPFMGDLVVVDMGTEEGWQVLRAGGEAMAERHPLGAGVLQQPLGLAASEDDLWVTDYATGSVVQLVADGEELAEPVTVVEKLAQPEGMALAPNGRLVVAETGTGRLLAVDPATGAVQVMAEGLGFTADNATSIGPTSLPPYWIYNGVAVGPSGAIYVSGDAANVIYRIPPAQ
jgi:glucose/arabinose dehydrogenase